jgi:hypothetical protein
MADISKSLLDDDSTAKSCVSPLHAHHVDDGDEEEIETQSDKPALSTPMKYALVSTHACMHTKYDEYGSFII